MRGDRFLIIDKTTLIHRMRHRNACVSEGRFAEGKPVGRPNVRGASFNRLGKKCFAFSSMGKSNIPDILAKI